MELKKNEIITADFTGYTSNGEGVCHAEGRAVFVKNALAGEKASVRILKVSNSAVYGKIEKLLIPSAERLEPRCPQYAKCGGCTLMHMTYGEELRMKKEKVDAAMARIGGLKLQTDCIHGDDSCERYRNKAIFAVGQNENRVITGFFRQRTHDVIPCESCLIQAEYAERAAAAVREWMQEHGVKPYHEQSRSGLIRHVFTRYSHASHEGMTVLVAAGHAVPETADLIQKIRTACPETVGVLLNTNTSIGNTVLSGSFSVLYGKDTIEEKICGLSFQISAQSFCQVNIRQAERLYQKALEYAGLSGKETVLDLYCGTGTITLCLSKLAGKVIGVEIVPEAIENAKQNAKQNRIDNVEFICADSSQAAVMLKNRGVRPDVLVIDPPRKGLAGDVIQTIIQMQPDRVVYVSCDPATLARDLAIFDAGGYAAQKAEAFDLFPRTSHVETVCLLVLRNPVTHINIDVDVEELVQDKRGQATYPQIKEYVMEQTGLKVSSLYISQIKRKCGLDVGDSYNKPKSEDAKVPQCPPEKEKAIMDAFRHFGMI